LADFDDRDDYQDDDDDDQRRPGRGPGGRRFARRPRVCAFCADHIRYIDYKQTDMLSRYVTERGQLRPRRKTGVCARHQRGVSVAVKRARHMALLPFTGEQVRLGSQKRG
jgi:small subunit ribosomal protein S18